MALNMWDNFHISQFYCICAYLLHAINGKNGVLSNCDKNCIKLQFSIIANCIFCIFCIHLYIKSQKWQKMQEKIAVKSGFPAKNAKNHEK